MLAHGITIEFGIVALMPFHSKYSMDTMTTVRTLYSKTILRYPLEALYYENHIENLAMFH
jgi:hypothetical protein